ncbi:MAG: dihydrolipoyl dehydrogenase [Halothiobacillus sp.]
MQSVDIITLGAGGGAYPAAFRLARAGLRVVMVDPKGVMSGNCLAEGCVPSKAVREVAELYRRASKCAQFGLTGQIGVDFAQVMAHKDQVQRTRYAQHQAELEPPSDRLSLIQGRARFEDAHTVVVETDQGEQTYTAAHILIATGSEVFIPPVAGAEHCITSHDLFALDNAQRSLPKRLVVIGGGYIGLETATFLRAFGSEVTVLEMADQVLPGMDPDFVADLVPLLDPSIRCLTGAQVERVTCLADGSRQVQYEIKGEKQTISADAVLMAAGRRPVIPEGAASIGLTLERGRIIVDAALRTNLPHIYACGDVNGRVPLFHAAVGQSLVAAHNILGGGAPLDYFNFDAVPTTIFTLPAAAYVGLTRAALKARGIDAIETAYDFTEDSRAQIFGETGGEIRLFFAPHSLQLLGGWVLGLDAEQLIGEIGLAVSKGLTARDLAAFCDPHPMASEGISKAARSLF